MSERLSPHTLVFVRRSPHGKRVGAYVRLVDLRRPHYRRYGNTFQITAYVRTEMVRDTPILDPRESFPQESIPVVVTSIDNPLVAAFLARELGWPPRHVNDNVLPLPAGEDTPHPPPDIPPDTPVRVRRCPTDLKSVFTVEFWELTDWHWGYAENGRAYLAATVRTTEDVVVISVTDNSWMTSGGIRRLYDLLCLLAGAKPTMIIPTGFADRRPHDQPRQGRETVVEVPPGVDEEEGEVDE
jgi:hypothetical protein